MIASHFGIPGFSAGFVGVDLFFVISGYLITSLIANEKLTTGKFNYLEFYARRCRRLLPSLISMLLVVFVLCGVFYAPREQMPQAINGMAAALWMSNIQLAFASSDYFEADSKSNLFLHTWSLGVEEQFYIVWPVMLIGIIGLATRYRFSDGKIVGYIVFIAFVSFCVSLWLSYYHPIQAYYLMPSRMWQFMLGAVAFYWHGKLTNESKFFVFTRANVFYLGWIGVVAALLFIRSDLSYPGYQAIVPAMSMALLLLCNDASFSNYWIRLLELPILQWLGDRSYSLYLWHWPIWLFVCSFQSEISFVTIFVSLAAVFVISAVFYALIERPIRKNKSGLGYKSTLSLSLVTVVVMTLLGSAWFDKADTWSVNSEILATGKYASDLPVLYKMGCDTDIYSSEISPCSFGSNDNSIKVNLWGDSIGAQWFPALFNLYGQDKYHIDVFIKSACSIVDATKFYAKIGRSYTECDVWREKVIARMKQNPPDILFIGSGLDDFTEKEWKQGVRSVLNEFNPLKTKIYLFRATPHLLNNPTQCMARQIWLNNFFPLQDLCHKLPESDSAKNELIASWMANVAADYTNVKVIDLNQHICPDHLCVLRDNGLVSFRDTQHLTASYVKTLTDVLGEVINAH